MRQQGWRGAHHQTSGPGAIELDTEGAQGVGMVFRSADLRVTGGKGRRDQQGLDGHGLRRLLCRLQTFIDDALVRGMHVHDDQAMPVLRQDVDAQQLSEREAQRKLVGLRAGRGLSRGSRILGRRGAFIRLQGQRFQGGQRRISPRKILPERRSGPHRVEGQRGSRRLRPVRKGGREALRCGGRLADGSGQHHFDGMAHGLVHGGTVPKPNLGLRGVHVHIDQLGRQVDEQRVLRLQRTVQHVGIRRAHAVGHGAVAHPAVVDNDVLHISPGAGRGGLADQAAQGKRADLGGHRQGVGAESFAQHCGQPVETVRGRVPLELQLELPVMPKPQRDGGVGDGGALEHVRAPGVFGLRRFEKFASRWQVEKKLSQADTSTRLGRRGLHWPDLARTGLNAGAIAARAAADEFDVRHGRHRRQCLAAETEMGGMMQFVEIGNLAGGVAQQRQR